MWKDFIKKHSLNRISRMEETIIPYVQYLEESKKHKEVVDVQLEKFKHIKAKVYFFGTIRMICYILLYGALSSVLFSGFYFLEQALHFITLVSSVVGSAILLFLISLTTRYIYVFVSDAHTIVSIIVSLAIKEGYVPKE